MRLRLLPLVAPLLLPSFAAGQAPPEEKDDPRFWAPDGWFDVSGFLDEKYGFLPIVLPITEPAVGYGAMAGLMFISSPLGDAKDGLGRPNITMVGGLATENGTWGALAADLRYWLDDRVQTLVGVVNADVNLEFHGIGATDGLRNHPLDYSLRPVGTMLQAKARLGDTRTWAGIGYSYAGTTVSFEDPAGTTGRPDFEHQTRTAALTPTVNWDTRDNMFTPTRGSYLGVDGYVYSHYFGGDDEFQKVLLTAMHYEPLTDDLFFGVRGIGAAAFGDTPFYMNPYIDLRGAPIMQYQGEEVAEVEVELRWQCWQRFSLVGFGGGGAAWNHSGAFDAVQKIVTGGAGFRYELAREFGIHAGLDVAFSRDNAAVYVQIGGAWTRP